MHTRAHHFRQLMRIRLPLEASSRETNPEIVRVVLKPGRAGGRAQDELQPCPVGRIRNGEAHVLQRPAVAASHRGELGSEGRTRDQD